MNAITRKSLMLAAASLAVVPLAGLSAQEVTRTADDNITVRSPAPDDLTGLTEGPEVEGFISARTAEGIEITSMDGTATRLYLSDATEIRGRGGFLGLASTQAAADSLLNGLPVTVKTVQWGGGLVASRVRFRDNDLETAAMIRTGTAQRFGENEMAIEQNAAATEALRGRMGDIDQYNLKGTTNVYFDTGRWQIDPQYAAQLCQTVQQANAMENALLLVVGYTDATGDQDFNQELSERRAGRVVNYLQQECGWAPYRMLTPTGMAEADPAADNTTEAGRAQNRRVAVNILVSKAVDGLGG